MNLPQAPLPRIFSYFDCTDYRDSSEPGGAGRPLLTLALVRKRNNAYGRLHWWSHLSLLIRYSAGQRPNVHGGYFEGELGRQLIFRLACLGYHDTVKAFGGKAKLSAKCTEKQIRVLLSPRLRRSG